jgi:hypothetical protein
LCLTLLLFLLKGNLYFLTHLGTTYMLELPAAYFFHCSCRSYDCFDHPLGLYLSTHPGITYVPELPAAYFFRCSCRSYDCFDYPWCQCPCNMNCQLPTCFNAAVNHTTALTTLGANVPATPYNDPLASWLHTQHACWLCLHVGGRLMGAGPHRGRCTARKGEGFLGPWQYHQQLQ